MGSGQDGRVRRWPSVPVRRVPSVPDDAGLHRIGGRSPRVTSFLHAAILARDYIRTVTNSLLSRRTVTVAVAAGLVTSCAPESPAPPDTPASDGGDEAAGGDETDGDDSRGDDPDEDDMVDAVIDDDPFDGLTVTRVHDGALESWDLTMLSHGTPILQYRLQGRWDGKAPQVDGYQRMEEAKALEGAPTLAGETVIPRSNWEFAFQIDVDGDKQFVPYHGTPTTFAAADPVVEVDGAQVPPEDFIVGEARNVSSFSLEQTVVARHPARGDTDLAEIATTTTWTREGRGRIDGRFRALEEFTVGNAYGPMLPFSRDIFDRVITDTGDDIAVDDDNSSETVPIANTTTARIASSDSGWSAAITWDEPERTLRTEGQSGGTDVFLQLRSDGIGKIYPKVWDSGDVVTPGTEWLFGAEWAVTAP